MSLTITAIALIIPAAVVLLIVILLIEVNRDIAELTTALKSEMGQMKDGANDAVADLATELASLNREDVKEMEKRWRDQSVLSDMTRGQ